jgi:hypothetical protein
VADHMDVINAVVAAIKLLPETHGFKDSDIKVVDFPFHSKPPFGLILSPLTEVEGESLNETSDIGYPVQIMRVGHRLSAFDGLSSRDDWRRVFWNRFNRTRLGLSCELMTRAEFEKIQLKEAWDNWNLDTSVLKVTTWIRQAHNG